MNDLNEQTSKTILVVDDDDAVRITLAAGLELMGFAVVEAETGDQALALLRKQPFQLVLSDIRMPGMNGGELFRHIKEGFPDMPVVLMTAYASEDMIRELTERGAYAILTKPFDLNHAAATVTRAIQRPIVLVVDDAESFANSITEALGLAGVRAEVALDGKTALNIVKQGNVDVCVVDMVMTGLSGPEVIEQLEAMDDEIRIVAITGHAVPELIADALRKGADQFLRKPIHPLDLLHIIARLRAEPS